MQTSRVWTMTGHQLYRTQKSLPINIESSSVSHRGKIERKQCKTSKPAKKYEISGREENLRVERMQQILKQEQQLTDVKLQHERRMAKIKEDHLQETNRLELNRLKEINNIQIQISKTQLKMLEYDLQKKENDNS